MHSVIKSVPTKNIYDHYNFVPIAHELFHQSPCLWKCYVPKTELGNKHFYWSCGRFTFTSYPNWQSAYWNLCFSISDKQTLMCWQVNEWSSFPAMYIDVTVYSYSITRDTNEIIGSTNKIHVIYSSVRYLTKVDGEFYSHWHWKCGSTVQSMVSYP